MQFSQYLRESHYLDENGFKQVQAEQNEVRNSTFYSAVYRSKVMTNQQLVDVAAEFFKMQKVSNPFKTEIDFDATTKVMGSTAQAIEGRMFVIRLNGKLTFVLRDPENDGFKSKAVSALGEEPEFALLTDEQFTVFLQYQLTSRAISEEADNIKTGKGVTKVDNEIGVNASYTQKLLDMLISAALDRRASDLHLLPLDDHTAQVMLRIDGKMYHYAEIKADVLENLRNKLRTLSQAGGDTPDAPVEGQISVNHRGVNIDIRINILHTVLGYDFNMRFIDANLKGLEELGLSQKNYNSYIRLLHMTKGLVILCGPTGSGKTSLLYAGFKKLLGEDRPIFTIEDPVEIRLPGTTQMAVQKEKHLTYEKIFPSALRHDPDIIGIGEIRTLEVAKETIRAANTGHLVFTTLHTNSAVGAISRLINLGLDAYSIGDVLAAVVAQRLVRRVCPKCAEEYDLEPDSEWRERYKLGDGKIVLKRGCGCEYCAGTGYRGRMAVNEFMLTTPKLRGAIQKKATRTELEEILESEGYKTYINDAAEKALAGVTTFDEVDELYRDIL